MSEVKAHYDTLLGSVYSWIIGDFDSACARNSALLERLNISPALDGLAVDLGAGPGNQSVPLAERGFAVVAIDFCASLLDELRTHAGSLDIRPVHADIVDFRCHLDRDPELVVCMGDTLVHLPDRDTAQRVLVDAADALQAGGSIVISIRDYDTPGPTGADRFIPIRSSPEQIFTCFLEYEEDIVQVHDILQQKSGDEWRLSISGYQKLRLGMDWVETVLGSQGLRTIDRLDDDGMRVLHARK